MADDTPAAESQADTEVESQADTSQQPSQADTTTSKPTDSQAETETISLKEARELRREAQQLRKRNKELEDAQLSEAEKVKRDLADLTIERDTLHKEVRDLKAQTALSAAGVIRPKLLVSELPDEALDDDKALESAIGKLRKSYPELFRATNGSADGGQHGTTTKTGGMNQLIREAAGVTTS